MTTTTHTHTNSGTRYQIVGDYTVIVSEHDTEAQAVAALAAIGEDADDIGDTEYAVLHVVAPGATVSGALSTPDAPAASSEPFASDLY
jgi:hypothetical protein